MSDRTKVMCIYEKKSARILETNIAMQAPMYIRKVLDFKNGLGDS